VNERLLDLDADAERGHLALRLAPREQILVADDPATAVHPQRLLHARNQEDEANVRVLQQILHAVQALVARPVGDQQPALVEDEDEPWRIALRRHVALPGGARRRQQQEGRAGDELAAVHVQRAVLLGERHGARGADQRAQLSLGGHGLLKGGHDLLPGRGPVPAV
jgi:hypothetical protein